MRVTAIELNQDASKVTVQLNARYVRNFAAPSFGAADVTRFIEDVTGREAAVRTCRRTFMDSNLVPFPQADGDGGTR